MNPAEETASGLGPAGAEGATAPETLRQPDRGGTKLWKAARALALLLTEGRKRLVEPRNLSGTATEGARPGGCPDVQPVVGAAMADVSTEPLLETPLHAAHVALGARMVPFAGYAMPVQY